MKLNFRDYHENILKALALFILLIYFFSSYDSFIGEIGHWSTNTKGKVFQAFLALLNRYGGKYIVVAVLAIPVLIFIIEAWKGYIKDKSENKLKDK